MNLKRHILSFCYFFSVFLFSFCNQALLFRGTYAYICILFVVFLMLLMTFFLEFKIEDNLIFAVTITIIRILSLILLLILFRSHTHVLLSNLLLCLLPFLLIFLFFKLTHTNPKNNRLKVGFFVQTIVSLFAMGIFILESLITVKTLALLMLILSTAGISWWLCKNESIRNRFLKNSRVIMFSLFTSLMPFLIFSLALSLVSHAEQLSNGWTIAFFLLFPATLIYLILKEGNKQQVGIMRDILVNFSSIFLFFCIVDIFIYVTLTCSFLDIFLINLALMIAILLTYIIRMAKVNWKVVEVNNEKEAVLEERSNIFSQFIGYEHVNELGSKILKLFEKQNVETAGYLVVSENEAQSCSIIAASGIFENMTTKKIKKDLLRNKNDTFSFGEFSCRRFYISANGKCLGYIIIARFGLRPDSEDEKLLVKRLTEIFCNILLLKNILLDLVNNKNFQLSPIERMVLLTKMDLVEREQQKLAIFIHDDILQELAGVKNMISMLEGDKKIISIVDESIKKTSFLLRDYIRDVYPYFVSMISFDRAIHSMFEELKEKYGDTLIVIKKVDDLSELEDRQKEMLYRTIKELVSNTYKYSQANTLHLTCLNDQNRKKIILKVKDDGIGLTKENLLESTRNFGLLSIMQEVKLFEGIIDIRSRINEGMEVAIILPY